jgi:hypothetical protein
VNKTKEEMLKIVGEVRDKIASGVSKNQACREAYKENGNWVSLDKRTYDKYVVELESKTKRDEEMKSITKKSLQHPTTPPINTHVTLKEMLIRLPIDDYNYLLEEKRKTGVAPATNAAKWVREKIRENQRKDSFASHINT